MLQDYLWDINDVEQPPKDELEQYNDLTSKDEDTYEDEGTYTEDEMDSTELASGIFALNSVIYVY